MDYPTVRHNKVTVFMNGNLNRNCKVRINNGLSIKDFLSHCQEKLGVSTTKKCKLFDSSGIELSDDDLEFTNADEPLFLSEGEEFAKESSLAIYDEISFLGKGGFGSVWLYRNKITDNLVALKFSDNSRPVRDIKRVFSEIAVLRNLSHPNIVQLLDAFQLQSQTCFVMEYCSGGELGQYLREKGPLPESEVYSIALQIVEALRYVHNSKVVHRDLKLENILFANELKDTIKIVDFGISGMFNCDIGERSTAGSLMYLAPEVLNGENNQANPALDVWSLGCIIYSLLTNLIPFQHETRKQVIDCILNGLYTPLPRYIKKPWHILLKHMLDTNPASRWSMLKVLEHLLKFLRDPDGECLEESVEFEEVKKPREKIRRSITIRQKTPYCRQNVTPARIVRKPSLPRRKLE